MRIKQFKSILLALGSIVLFFVSADAFATGSGNAVGVGTIATNVTNNLGAIASLITAGSYVAGMGFAVGAVVKFKAHKDNPTQIPIGMPIALLFVAAALMFIPNVFSSAGATLFGTSATQATISGVQTIKIGS
jgi:intracellular multiplication protein IcmD